MTQKTESTEKLIQLRVSDDVKKKADTVFNKQGITIQGAIKMFLTQVANTGNTPFDGMFQSRS